MCLTQEMESDGWNVDWNSLQNDSFSSAERQALYTLIYP